VQRRGQRNEVGCSSEVRVDLIDVLGPVTVIGIAILCALRDVLNHRRNPDLKTSQYAWEGEYKGDKPTAVNPMP